MNEISPAHRPKNPFAYGSSPYWLGLAGFAICIGVAAAIGMLLVSVVL